MCLPGRHLGPAARQAGGTVVAGAASAAAGAGTAAVAAAVAVVAAAVAVVVAAVAAAPVGAPGLVLFFSGSFCFLCFFLLFSLCFVSWPGLQHGGLNTELLLTWGTALFFRTVFRPHAG